MHRRREFARKLEARNGQLQIGIGQFDDGFEHRHRQRPDAHGLQGSVQAVACRPIDQPVMFFGERRIFVALSSHAVETMEHYMAAMRRISWP